VAEVALVHPGRDLALRLIFVLAADHAPAAARIGKPRAVLLSLLRLRHLLHPALEIARRVCLGLCRVRAARAKGLHAVPMAVLSHRDELARLVSRLQTAQAMCLPALLQALP